MPGQHPTRELIVADFARRRFLTSLLAGGLAPAFVCARIREPLLHWLPHRPRRAASGHGVRPNGPHSSRLSATRARPRLRGSTRLGSRRGVSRGGPGTGRSLWSRRPARHWDVLPRTPAGISMATERSVRTAHASTRRRTGTRTVSDSSGCGRPTGRWRRIREWPSHGVGSSRNTGAGPRREARGGERRNSHPPRHRPREAQTSTPCRRRLRSWTPPPAGWCARRRSALAIADCRSDTSTSIGIAMQHEGSRRDRCASRCIRARRASPPRACARRLEPQDAPLRGLGLVRFVRRLRRGVASARRSRECLVGTRCTTAVGGGAGGYVRHRARRGRRCVHRDRAGGRVAAIRRRRRGINDAVERGGGHWDNHLLAL